MPDDFSDAHKDKNDVNVGRIDFEVHIEDPDLDVTGRTEEDPGSNDEIPCEEIVQESDSVHQNITFGKTENEITEETPEKLSLIGDPTDKKVESRNIDGSRPSAVIEEESFNAELISITESEQKTVDDNKRERTPWRKPMKPMWISLILLTTFSMMNNPAYAHQEQTEKGCREKFLRNEALKTNGKWKNNGKSRTGFQENDFCVICQEEPGRPQKCTLWYIEEGHPAVKIR